MRHRGRCPRRSRAGARPSPVAERPTGRPRCTGATAARRRRSPRDRATCPLALPDLALQREGALGARLEGHPARAARARDELRAASAVDDRAGEAAYPASRGMGIAPIRARSLRNLRSQTQAPPARPHLPTPRLPSGASYSGADAPDRTRPEAGPRSARFRHEALDSMAGREADRGDVRCALPSQPRLAAPQTARLELPAPDGARAGARRGGDPPLEARPVADTKKNAAAQGQTIAFVDASGRTEPA